MDCFIVRFGEIAIKGGNRRVFENMLCKNIRKRVLDDNNIKYKSIQKNYGRIVVFSNNNLDLLKYIFGIVSFSKAVRVGKNIQEIKNKALELVNNERSFAVKARRADKNFILNSIQIEKEVGAFIVKHKKMGVDLKNPEVKVFVEILQDGAYLYNSINEGYGGLPVGCESTVLSLVKNNLLASLLFMKRGNNILPVGFKEVDINSLSKYGNKNKFVKIKDIKEAEAIAKENNINSLVVDSTFDNFDELKTDLIVFCPLITYTAKDIEKEIVEFNCYLK